MIRKSAARIILSLLVLSGCNEANKTPAERAPAQQAVNNISEKRIFLKDLTTGVKYEKKKYPTIIFSTENTIKFNYDYFGDRHVISAEMNADKIVTSYEILMHGDLSKLRAAIAAKASSENGKTVEFLCTTYKASEGGLDWETKSCNIDSGHQILLIEEKKPLGPKPISADYETWKLMHMSKLRLVEGIELSKEGHEKAKKAAAEQETAIRKKLTKKINDI